VFELERIFSPTLASIMIAMICIMVIGGGFIFVKKKQQSEKGFFYKLLLSLQIFFWPFVILGFLPIYIRWFEIYRVYSLNPYYVIYHLLNIPIVIHGAYTGVKMLKVTERTKRGMKLNLLMNIVIYFINPRIFSNHFAGYPYYIGIFVLATFFFCCYQYVRSLKSDEPIPDNIKLQKI